MSWSTRLPAAALALLLSAGTGSHLAAQGSELGVFGLATGAPITAMQGQFAKLGAKPICKTSSVDARVAECTATLLQAPDRRNWSLTASVVDGTTGVLMLRTSVDARGLAAIRADWISTFGRPNLRKRGEQETYEWIRAGRMLRLGSRPEGGRFQILATLVEGAVLDRLDGGR